MPSKAAHLELAKRNGEMLVHLVERIDQFPEWAATVAFYRALHLVEAAFAVDKEIGHGGDHGTRNWHLKKKKKYAKVYAGYRPLWAASIIARYLENDEQAGSYICFSEYLSAHDVNRKLVRHYLRVVESSVEQLLGEPLSPIALPPLSA
ncbi:MAG: hypothetical protein K2X38_00495 [Gemmataceae bacterium]|nr:hypothetical protein [Gemmataceae bacterium]